LEKILLGDRDKNSHLVEFDLVLDDDQYGTLSSIGPQRINKFYGKRQKRKAVRHSIYHWPGATVPYVIDSSVGKLIFLLSGQLKLPWFHMIICSALYFGLYTKSVDFLVK